MDYKPIQRSNNMDYGHFLKYMTVIVELEKEKMTIKSVVSSVKSEIVGKEREYYERIGMPPIPPSYLDEPPPLSTYSDGVKAAFHKYINDVGWLLAALLVVVTVMYVLIDGYFEYKHLIINNSIYRRFYQSASQAYPKQRERHDREMEVFRHKSTALKGELAQLKSSIQIILDTLEKTYDKTDRLLQDYYALDIIPKGYRDFVPVCMFYDYLSSKRTYSLYRNPNGSDPGAINMYEDEKDRRIIMTKLDSIISNLKSIQVRQSYLYDAITDSTAESNRIMTSISQSLSDGNNALAYNNYLNEVNNAQNRYRNDLLTRMYYGY